MEETNRAIDGGDEDHFQTKHRHSLPGSKQRNKAAEAAQRRLAELRATPADKRGDDTHNGKRS